MSPFGRSSLVGIGSVAAPVAVYFFLKVTIGLGPSESPAQPPATDPAVLPGAGGPAPQADPIDELRLSALLTSGDAGWATIDGTVYRVGDAVAAGYSLRSIDIHGQRAELIGPDGQPRWLSRGR